MNKTAAELYRDLVTWKPQLVSYGDQINSYYDEAPSDDWPFFTEGVAYELFDQDDARSLLGLIRRLGESIGQDMQKIQMDADK